MTYEDLWLYVNNQYTNAMQAGMLGTDIVISKEDYFFSFGDLQWLGYTVYTSYSWI